MGELNNINQGQRMVRVRAYLDCRFNSSYLSFLSDAHHNPEVAIAKDAYRQIVTETPHTRPPASSPSLHLDIHDVLNLLLGLSPSSLIFTPSRSSSFFCHRHMEESQEAKFPMSISHSLSIFPT